MYRARPRFFVAALFLFSNNLEVTIERNIGQRKTANTWQCQPFGIHTRRLWDKIKSTRIVPQLLGDALEALAGNHSGVIWAQKYRS